MHGLMLNAPLLISSLIQHADRYHGGTEIVSRMVEGGFHRYNYAEAHRRTRQLANALKSLGVRVTDRVGTLKSRVDRTKLLVGPVQLIV